ncbi:MAG: hypothetical protein H6638_00230 [Ardenticatenales bacterium]|nr:hypothetical protein [Ardenticatenales bacterium]
MSQSSLASRQRAPMTQSSKALWGGMAFSLLFTALIAVAGYRLEPLEATFLPDAGASWYFWKLVDPTAFNRTVVWTLYAVHQLAFWGLIYYAQRTKHRYTKGLHPVNQWALGMNAFFIVLHFIQTHWLYDGLAQDVSIWSSQASVVLLLVAVLAMENRRRGLFWGKKAPLNQRAVDWLRHYHGYLFSWAIVYTFWYHPMTDTMGHLIGFFYMFMLMVQGSLFFTRAHLNRYWTVSLELMVAAHGTLVAVQQGNGIWPMFFFGFVGIFVITQMHGLRWPAWLRWATLAAYLAFMAWVYAGRGLANLNEVIRIPLIEYLLVFILVGLVLLIAKGVEALRPSRAVVATES